MPPSPKPFLPNNRDILCIHSFSTDAKRIMQKEVRCEKKKKYAIIIIIIDFFGISLFDVTLESAVLLYDVNQSIIP